MPRPSTDPQIDLLLRLIDESYEKKAWHGPNLRGSIRGLSLAEAAFRPTPERHNIWEILLHAAYWKYVVWRRLRGEKKGSFPLPGSNWFARPDAATKRGWQADIKLLDEMHRELRSAVADVPAQSLRSIPRGSKISNLAIITGIASHDVYHAGQIQILKRLARS